MCFAHWLPTPPAGHPWVERHRDLSRASKPRATDPLLCQALRVEAMWPPSSPPEGRGGVATRLVFRQASHRQRSTGTAVITPGDLAWAMITKLEYAFNHAKTAPDAKCVSCVPKKENQGMA